MAIATSITELSVEAAAEDVRMSSARLGNVSRLVQRYIDERKLPGAISLVARRGSIVHFETYGNMDDERQKPMRSDTIFRFYSMTKPIASVGLMMLYEEGRFQLEDPASKFIPELKDANVFASGTVDSYSVRDPLRPMTVRDLLMHTSGLASRAAETPIGELYRLAGLDGVRILGPRTLTLMTLNHLPGGKDLATMAQSAGETAREGIGFGLGFAVLLDPTVAQIIGTPGEYYWGGAASTAFFVNPKEELVMIFLTQLRPSSTYPIRRELRQTIYSSIVE